MHFRDVRHQEAALALLRRALRHGRLAHAYLFAGPAGVGKERAARALAARLLCGAAAQDADADACGACDACRLLVGENHPDFHLIHRGLHKLHPDPTVRAGKGLFLGVDVIRRFLIEPANSRPAISARRIFVVRDAERMNEQAANALLKTLEEPPGAACLILVSASAERLPATIRSRCQLVRFNLLPPEFVRAELRRAGADEATATTLAGLAEGRLGDALAWRRADLLADLDRLSTALAAGATQDAESFAKQVCEGAVSLARRLSATEEAIEADDAAADESASTDEPRGRGGEVATDELRAALKLSFLLISAIYRDALRLAAGAPGATPAGHVAAPRALAQRTSVLELQDAIAAVAGAERMLDRNVAPQLVCERLALALDGAAPLSLLGA